MVAMKATAHRRRGVLLLVVLSMLTLFLMLGSTYLTIATRARRAARAFTNSAVAGTAATASEQRLLDAAFMSVARGVSAPAAGGAVPHLGSGEDLLGDKYGATPPVTGRVTGATALVTGGGTSNALFRLTTSGISPSPESLADLHGRVVTLLLPGLTTSTRILQASGSLSSPTLIVASGPTPAGYPLSRAGVATAVAAVTGTQPTLVINGREFSGDPATSSADTNEPWDAADSRNPLLAASGSLSPFSLTGTVGFDVDNDGDGTADSRFVDIGLPSITDSDGQEIYPRAAILVVDLDGRLNVNAHGSEADSSTINQYPTFNANTGTGAAISIPMGQLPRGAPLGPASVSIARGIAFDASGANPLSKADLPVDGTRLIGGGTVSGTQPIAVLTYREIPRIGAAFGRCGDAVWGGTTGATLSAAPGRALVNDPISIAADAWRASLDTANNSIARYYFSFPGRCGSPVDLRGRMRLWLDGFGQPVYYKPSWMSGSFNEVVDDPYEVNLTRLGSRPAYAITPAATGTPADTLFTPAELEGLLRFYDPDSLKLPRRLVTLSGTNAPKLRRMVTTESWDTPAVVGPAWKTVIGGANAFATFIATSATSSGSDRPQDLFSPETLLGHKLDLNRPFHDTSFDEPNDTTGNQATGTLGRRQVFARQLYCLLTAIVRANNAGSLSPANARKLAQYAVNVVDFRDADSVMTQFYFDPAFAPGSTSWSPGANDYVWGCERPEVVMTETLAWHNRRTDDLSVGNKCVDTPATSGKTPDNDLDQIRRPWGAFFVELYSPWGSRACQLATSGTVTDVLTGTTPVRGEPVPATLTTTGTAEFARTGTLDISATAPGGAPVWRLASVLGNVQGGTGFDASGGFVDPAAPGSSAVVDRIFYFNQPPATLSSGTESGGNAAVFWASSVDASPSQSRYVVAGTDNLLFDYHDTFPDPHGNTKTNGYENNTSAPVANAPGRVLFSYTNQVPIRFDMVDKAGGPGGSGTASRPVCASLTEPVLRGDGSKGNDDAYTMLAEAVHGANNKFFPDWHAVPHRYDDSANPTNLQNPTDLPLDAVDPAAYGLSGVITPRVLMKGTSTPILMVNGTHDNFAVIHLQRLANPTIAYHATNNPYVTVDSLPVDLTVVNTMDVTNNGITGAAAGATRANVDDPSIATQKNYRFRSVERGGKWADAGVAGTDPPACDIWSSRVFSAGKTNLTQAFTTTSGSNPDPFRTAATSNRPATSLSAGISPSLQAAPGYGTSGDMVASTFRKYSHDTSGVPISGLPSRFFANGGSEPASPRFPWLFWANRPFNTILELAMVPVGNACELPRTHTTGTGGPNSLQPAFHHLTGLLEATTPAAPWNAVTGRIAADAPSIFDFVHVPSPFAAVYSTVRSGTATAIDIANTGALRQLGFHVFPINQLSGFREPGRVNANTIGHAGVWRGLFGSVTAQGDADVSSPATGDDRKLDKLPGWNASAPVMKTLQEVYQRMPNAGETTARNASGGYLDRFVTERDLDGDGVINPAFDANGDGTIDPDDPAEQSEDRNGNGILDNNDHRDTNRNAYFRYQTMNQLANVTTVRSHVFAVWVTIGYFDSPTATAELAPVRRNRGFYILDRSIPVAYERGRDHNVRDAILLRRIIE